MADTHTAVSGVRQHAHHFASADDEFEASKQGMWIFLVTEVLMFGSMFVGFAMFHGLHPEAFKAAHHHLDVKLGTINTIVLIMSSLTMMLSVIATQRGRSDRAIMGIVVSFLLACAFLVIKYFEWSHKFHEGLLPGGYFSNELGQEFPKAALYFSFYFMMTGIHGLHVIIGMGLMIWLLMRLRRNEFSPHYYTPVELVGFYWHFVDIVWIYLFPLLYLIN